LCVDRPQRNERLRNASIARGESADRGRMVLRLALPIKKKWTNGRTLRVAFLDGDAALQDRVAEVAAPWVDAANLNFDFAGPAEEADIRVTFLGVGSWSHVGTDAKAVGSDQPTLCLGWLTAESSDDVVRQAVLHEFGHALGAVHEHDSPAGGVPWDRPAVYAFYKGPPNRWSVAEVDANVFAKYDDSVTQFSDFDPDSIMIYPIPDELTIGDYSIDWNPDLSPTDRKWIGIAYPLAAPDPLELMIDGAAIGADIGEHGEWDEFHFSVTNAGRYAVETHGPTDVMMAVAGPDDPERIVAEDDDSGREYNARVEATLEPGAYVVRVWHHWPTGMGGYEVSVGALR
jgi:hypothetical protein